MTNTSNRLQSLRDSSVSRRNFVIGSGAAAVGGAALLAACGDDETAPAATTTAAAPATTAAAETGVGTTTLGSNYSDANPKAALAAAVAATGVDTEINTIDHNTYQDNFNTYVQQPDDVMAWFAGYRMRAFASKGVVGDISDVWDNLDGMSGAFRSASSGLDGNQYFVPLYFYPWAVHYRKSLFADNGYDIPANWDEFKALCDTMEADGLIPLCAANDGRWPQMGMFDMLNLRINGYDFHVSLMGGREDWEDARVQNVFSTWEEILPYYQPDANGRTWQDAANNLGDKSAGMYLLGTFVVSNFDREAQADIIDDIDFFLFPEVNPEHGQDAIEAPIDGFMMAAEPANEAGAKALLTGLGSVEAIDAYLSVDPAVVAANSNADTSGYNALQRKSAEAVATASYIAQFLDRDTDPDFAANVVGVGIADFLATPGSIGTILADIEAKKQTFTFE
ncbi:MAG: carbohydrate ABC transporter substrate-binding protein [Acidimicrobiaceae bacterium]|nr:carbohydrate ABC transporter substrate-binding protein [Acidimicrobiaceae bacterium]MXZ97577.1 carbohydrate ABC transporter substrate-binding protein [Acidimicrobiaceae bacterium]MYI52817.1 carbohydrate ABC transporter substrate-binding protein [Acidimicrobiaceae bacterium]